MISVGDKARVTKGHPSGYEDTITRMFLAASGETIYQLDYDFVQCQRDEFEIIEPTTDIKQQYRVGETALYSCTPGEPPKECLVFEVQYDKVGSASVPPIMYYIRAGYADFRIVYPHELMPVTYSLF